MIELNKKADIYAEENVINVLKEAIAKVYTEGYRAGYKDCQEEIPVDLRTNQTEFVNLGLPSGTLWSSDYITDNDELLFLPYHKAALLSIPTEEQWNELMQFCKLEVKNDNKNCIFKVIGPNGKTLTFYSRGYKQDENIIRQSRNYFWICDNGDSDDKNVANMGRTSYNNVYRIDKLFSGYKLPIRLVKTKRE